MEKDLTKLGNSSALVLDKVIMELIGITPDSKVKLTVRGDELIIRAASPPETHRSIESEIEPQTPTADAEPRTEQTRPPVLDFQVLEVDADDFDSSTPKKRAFLIGDEPKATSVHTLLKMALYRGQSINAYDLVTGERRFQWNNVKGEPRKSDFRDYWIEHGHEIDHPNDIPFSDAKRWVEYGRQQAKRHSLQISNPSSRTNTTA